MKCFICRSKFEYQSVLNFNTDGQNVSYNLCQMCFNNMISGIEICRENCSPAKLQNHVSLLNSQNDSALMDSLKDIWDRSKERQNDE